ncbi:MAG: hypothetical protein WC926_04040 [Candidatus Paceibacterota bacterium]
MDNPHDKAILSKVRAWSDHPGYKIFLDRYEQPKKIARNFCFDLTERSASPCNRLYAAVWLGPRFHPSLFWKTKFSWQAAKDTNSDLSLLLMHKYSLPFSSSKCEKTLGKEMVLRMENLIKRYGINSLGKMLDQNPWSMAEEIASEMGKKFAGSYCSDNLGKDFFQVKEASFSIEKEPECNHLNCLAFLPG